MTVHLDPRSVRFPASGHIWVPAHGRRAAASGLSMHSPCRRSAVFVQRALYAAVLIAGPRILPGERASWATPVDTREWETILADWEREVGHFDSLAVYHRPQADRSGFAALLMRSGRGVAFARLHPEAARVRREYDTISGVHAADPQSFRVAQPIAVGGDSWTWMLTSSVPNYPLGALRSARRRAEVVREIGEVLADVLERPAEVPSHWVAAHGDFTPWNARTDLARHVHVIDWEDAGYAPPGVDALYGSLTAHTTFGSPLPARAPREAQGWLDALLAERVAQQRDAGDANTTLRALLNSIPAS